MNQTTKKIVRAALIAALYAALSMAAFPIASGAIQFRISEGLTLLPLVFPEAIAGVFVGCIVTNLITGCMWVDTVFGSIITLIAAILTYFVGKYLRKTWLKIFVGGLFPVLLNSFLLPVVWTFCYGLEYTYFIQAAFLLLGESVSVYAVGIPVIIAINKYLKFSMTVKAKAETEYKNKKAVGKSEKMLKYKPNRQLTEQIKTYAERAFVKANLKFGENKLKNKKALKIN